VSLRWLFSQVGFGPGYTFCASRSALLVYSLFVRHPCYSVAVPEKWCTVTVTDDQGRRHSLDLQAASTFDAAHVYVCHVKEHPERGHPCPTLATLFEVVIESKVYRVEGLAYNAGL
jgi:hypothetical protein